MKTIAQQLNITEFPLEIKDSKGKTIYCERSNRYWSKGEYDSDGRLIYYETSDKYWKKWEFNSDGNIIYYEDSNGTIEDNRPKIIEVDGTKYKWGDSIREIKEKSCDGKIVEMDGKKYKLVEIK